MDRRTGWYEARSTSRFSPANPWQNRSLMTPRTVIRYPTLIASPPTGSVAMTGATLCAGGVSGHHPAAISPRVIFLRPVSTP